MIQYEDMTEHNLREFYTGYYRNEKDHDSPNLSRANMKRRILREIQRAGSPLKVLDIGAGRGDIEGAIFRELNGRSLDDRELVRNSTFVSIDIADIQPERIIKKGQRTHIQADSRKLPFADEAFDLVFSNLSIDMLRRNKNGDYERALEEMRRVTKLGGVALLSFHPASLFTKLSESYAGDRGVAAGYFDGITENNPFYNHEGQIHEDLTGAGFAIMSTEFFGDGVRDEWWEVAAIRGR